MLLNIYLATTVASVAIDFTKTLTTRETLLNKGYVFSNKKIAGLFSTIANLFVPGLNVWNAYKILKRDEKKFENELVKRGIIYKPEEKRGFTYTQQVTSSSQTKEETEQPTRAKTFDEMTTEEKREFLLRQRERILSDLSSTEEEINTLGRSK